MNRRSMSLALALLLLLLLTACGGSSQSAVSRDNNFRLPESEAAMPEDSYQYTANGGFSPSESSGDTPEVNADKIIYSAEATVETREYDKTLEAIYAMADTYGGFLEDSSIGGTSYYSRGGRNAQFTLRVPSERFSEVTGSLSNLGNVTYCRTYSENVTTEYIDVESRLDSYRIQEERLLAMLEKADRLEDMLTIEEHLADVRYNIENYTTQLKYLDSQVSYSTVTLSVEEVVEYSPDQSTARSFTSRMQTAFRSSISGLVDLVQGLILFLLRSWYILLILAAVIFFGVRRIRRFIARRKSEKGS